MPTISAGTWEGPAPSDKPMREKPMTSATISGLDTAPIKHDGILAWAREVAELTQPDRMVFADGFNDAD